MSDPKDNTGAPAAAAPVLIEPVAQPAVEAPVVAPASEAPVATPVAPTTPAPPVAEPVVEGASETPAEPAKPAPHETATLLEGAGKEPPKEGEPAKPGDAPAAAPAAVEPVVFEPFTLPDGVTLQPERIGEFTSVLTAADLAPQQRAQQLIDMHVAEMTRITNDMAERQLSAWDDTRREWRTQVMADEHIGGAGHNTAMGAIARMRDMFVPEADRKAFDDYLRVTGSGDHPALLKMLYNVARRFDEPAPAPLPHRPPPNAGKPPGGRRSDLYDHPSSPRRGG